MAFRGSPLYLIHDFMGTGHDNGGSIGQDPLDADKLPICLTTAVIMVLSTWLKINQ